MPENPKIRIDDNFQTVIIKSDAHKVQKIPLWHTTQTLEHSVYEDEGSFTYIDGYGQSVRQNNSFLQKYKGYTHTGEHDGITTENVSFQEKDGPVFILHIEYTDSEAYAGSQTLLKQKVNAATITIYDTTNETAHIVQTKGNTHSVYGMDTKDELHVFTPIVTSTISRDMTQKDKENAQKILTEIDQKVANGIEILKEEHHKGQSAPTPPQKQMPKDSRGNILDEDWQKSVRGLAEGGVSEGSHDAITSSAPLAAHHEKESRHHP